jgi:hypothetical protein
MLTSFTNDTIWDENGVWRSPVARVVRDDEVVGSNPATPTLKRINLLNYRLIFFFAPPGVMPGITWHQLKKLWTFFTKLFFLKKKVAKNSRSNYASTRSIQ